MDEETKMNATISIQYLQIQAILITGLLVAYTLIGQLNVLSTVSFVVAITASAGFCCYNAYFVQQVLFGKLSHMNKCESETFQDKLRLRLHLQFWFIFGTILIVGIGIILEKFGY